MVGAGSRWRCSFGASCGFVYLAQTQSVLPGQRRCGAPMVQTGRGGDAARYVVETNTVIQTVEASLLTQPCYPSTPSLLSSRPVLSAPPLRCWILGKPDSRTGQIRSLSLSLSLMSSSHQHPRFLSSPSALLSPASKPRKCSKYISGMCITK